MGGKISKILLIFIAFGLIGTIVYWGFNFSSTQAADILSPLPGEVAIPTPVSTFYEKVMKSNTSDNLPKTKYFPENLGMTIREFQYNLRSHTKSLIYSFSYLGINRWHQILRSCLVTIFNSFQVSL